MSMPDFSADPQFLALITQISHVIPLVDPKRCATIGKEDEPLAERIIVKKSPAGCVYLHRWLRSDPDDFHDHPWDSCSLIVSGGYWEVTPEGSFWRAPGEIVFRKAEDRHRIELDPDFPEPVSLFITGVERREWGFHTAKGFVIGRDYPSVAQYRKRRNAVR